MSFMKENSDVRFLTGEIVCPNLNCSADHGHLLDEGYEEDEDFEIDCDCGLTFMAIITLPPPIVNIYVKNTDLKTFKIEPL